MTLVVKRVDLIDVEFDLVQVGILLEFNCKTLPSTPTPTDMLDGFMLVILDPLPFIVPVTFKLVETFKLSVTFKLLLLRSSPIKTFLVRLLPPI